MPRLCRHSSRPYPGRPVRHAAPNLGAARPSAMAEVTGQESAEAMVGAGKRALFREASPRRRAEHETGKEPQ
jgi:hypothetical protein